MGLRFFPVNVKFVEIMIWKILALYLLISLLGGSVSGAEMSWTIVALPDTQKYSESAERIYMLLDQTQWIVSNLKTKNIVFVTHEGDIVEHRRKLSEWKRADKAISMLDGDLHSHPDGLVPYAVAMGNHDFHSTNKRRSDASEYLAYFGPSRYTGRTWYLGASPTGLNHAQFFRGGGRKFLHLSLELEVGGSASDPATPLGWAQSMLDAHPNIPTIITTHSYMWDKRGAEGRTSSAQARRGNSGEVIFQELISPNPQVFMVLNGHWHKAPNGIDGEYHQISINLAGLPVYEMLADYQDYPDTDPDDGIDDGGGNGYLRLIKFVPGGGAEGLDRIQVKTYSPTLNTFQTDFNSQFAFDLNFDDRFDVSDVPEMQMATFKQNVAGYGSVVDTFLQEASPNADNSRAKELNVDTDDPPSTGKKVQALVRFGDLFGTGPKQIHEGVRIISAKLRVYVTNAGNRIELHRMLTAWKDTDTWKIFAGKGKPGIQAGYEAEVARDAMTDSVNKGPLTIDVTESLLAWSDVPDPNSANLGWVFLPTGADGVDFCSAEGANPPELSVIYVHAPNTLKVLER